MIDEKGFYTSIYNDEYYNRLICEKCGEDMKGKLKFNNYKKGDVYYMVHTCKNCGWKYKCGDQTGRH